MSSYADLRKSFSLHNGGGAVAAHAARIAAGPTAQALSDRLWRLSLPHRVHPAGANLVAGVDLLPMGGRGAGRGHGRAVAGGSALDSHSRFRCNIYKPGAPATG